MASALAVLGACAAPQPSPGDFADVPGIGSTRVNVPRPTTLEGVGCTVAVPAGQSLAERAIALRGIGLFSTEASKSDAEFGAEIESQVGGQWGGVPPDDFIFELLVAEHDVARAWWRDLEADVHPESSIYELTLEEWADISVGAFAPTSIDESWQSETGPIDVSFDMNGSRHVIHPEYLDDWIDPRISVPVNALIESSGRRFEFFKAFDQSAFVMAVTPAERDGLKARGWCFE